MLTVLLFIKTDLPSAYADDKSATHSSEARPTSSQTSFPTSVCKTVPTDTGRVITTVTLDSSAKYTVWSRVMAPDEDAASYYLLIDNQCGIKVGGNSLHPHVWSWIHYSDGYPTNKIVLTLTKGSHVVKLIGNTPNLGLDKVIFTRDMSCVPTGMGNNCNQVVTPTVVANATVMPSHVPTGTTASQSAVPTASTPTGPLPTNTPAPTATPVSGTQFAVTILLHGVGHGGDNVAPDSQGNDKPIHIQRTAAVEVYDSNNVLVASPTGTVTFDPHTGTYKGIISVGRTLPAGAYITKITVAHHLNKSAVTIVTIKSGEPNPIPLAAASMMAGDLDGDGKLTINDFNIMKNCLSDLGEAKHCTPEQKEAADINDDGVVNLLDLNLYFRELAVQSGQ